MEIARLKVQGGYSLLAGLILLLGIPLYQAIVLSPTGYQILAATAFTQGTYGPLLLWIGSHSQAFAIFRLLEFGAFLLTLRLPLALSRILHSYGSTLARWVLIAGTTGATIFGAMIALSTFTFINAANAYSQSATPAARSDVLQSFQGFYGIEALAQNTLGGGLLAAFLLCASLLIARTGKLPALFVYFGLLAAALMAGLALLYAISPLSAQTQLTTPALAAFAVWLIWLGILLLQRARRLIAPAVAITAPTAQDQDTPPPDSNQQAHSQSEAASATSPTEQTPSAQADEQESAPPTNY
jgi:hypothetical protein